MVSAAVELPERFPHTVVYREIQALEEVNLPVISRTLLTVFLSLVGLQQPKVCGHVIVKPLEENMFLPETNEDVVRTLQPVRVSSFQG